MTTSDLATGPLLLGVDVGNSKTDVAVASRGGTGLAVVTGPGASPQAIGAAGSWRLIRDLIHEVMCRSGRPPATPVEAAVYAVAGLDFDDEIDSFLAASPAALPPLARAVNDTFAVLRLAATGEGIAVVAGAGMNCAGVCGASVARLPALGLLSGDWGGGIVLGQVALAAACRAADGRGPATVLRTVVPDFFGRRTPQDVTLAVHRNEIPASALTALARAVLEGADSGDRVCAALVRRQADEVVALVGAVARQLDNAPPDLPIVLGGGLLRAGCRSLDDRIHERLARRWPQATVTVTRAEPVVGALLLAEDLVADVAGRPITKRSSTGRAS